MENKKQYEKQKKRNYNQYIEEEGIKEEKSKENQKKIKEVLKPKLKGDENNQINLIDESKVNNTKRESINGIMYYKNGNRYEGEYKNDLRECIKGIMYMGINMKENLKII